MVYIIKVHAVIRGVCPNVLGGVWVERLKTSNHVVGRKQSEKAIKAGRGQVAFVAEDADAWLRDPFLGLCEENKVSVIMVPSMRELAKACRVEVPTAVAVLLD